MASDFISINPVSTTRSIGQPGNCHNRLGKNQYKDRPPPDDPEVAAALKVYHQKGINDSQEISKLLLEDHGVILCGSSVKRRRQKLGLLASRATTSQMSEGDKRRLVLEEMAKDPKGKCGPQMIKQRIFQETGTHLSRDYIREEMRKLDPESYTKRGPRHAKIKRIERLAREAQNAPTLSTSDQPLPVSDARTETPSTTRFIVHVCGSDRATPFQDPLEHDIESQSEDDRMESETSDIPPTESLELASNTLPQPTSPLARSHFMANASSLLENVIPSMNALTQLLKDSTSNLEFDQGTHELFIGGIESSALLEQQLSRVISLGRIVGRPGPPG